MSSDVCFPEDFNDEKERLANFTNVIYECLPIFPKDVARLIASYGVLFNVSFAPEFKKVIKTLKESKYHHHLNSYGIVNSPYPLSQSVLTWTIETKDSQRWSAGLYHQKRKLILEVRLKQGLTIPNYEHSGFGFGDLPPGFVIPPELLEVPEPGGFDNGVYYNTKPGTKITFKIDLKNGNVILKVDEFEPIVYWQHVEHLSEYVPFFSFTQIRASMGFRVVS
jgi:hypothetical protein